MKPCHVRLDPPAGLGALLAVLPLLLLAGPGRGLAGEPPATEAKGQKPCCHGTTAAADAPLPAGMAALADDEAPAPLPSTAVTLAEAPLLDQDGRSVRFPGEVLDGRIVVVDFVFTSCTTICPLLSARLARLQERLGARLDREVRLVSVSIDPARDTPARLKAYGQRFKAGPGWTWLTGEPEEVTRVLKGMGAYAPDFANHAPFMLVGDARSGRWTRLNGFPTQEALLAAVDRLALERQVLAGAAGGR